MMAVVKRFKTSEHSFATVKPRIQIKQGIIFSSLISIMLVAALLGNLIYLSNSIWQLLFVRLTSIGF